VRPAGFARRFAAAAALGWQVESNWADPFLFAVYSLARPLATALILVAMYAVVLGQPTGGPRFAWMYVGNAFYVFVSMAMVGIGWTIVEDRENYQVLKYVYVSPVGLFTYLAGRGLTKLVLASISAAVLLALGGLAFHVGYRVSWTGLGLGGVALALGLVGLLGLGWVLAGLALVFARQSVSLNEGTAAVLYLLCGAIFPVDLLPAPLRAASLAIPVTWWLEALRRAVLGVGAAGVVGRLSDLGVLVRLATTAVAWYAAGAWIYRRLERRAKQLGLIDQTTAF
jgi:ABC-2 type transport system permease protein